MRLDRFLAQAAVGKRIEVRDYIKDGKVKVNGIVINEPSIEIEEKMDNIEYNCEVIAHMEKRYYMFNKPMGCVTAKTDKEQKTVFDYFSEEDSKGLFHVGRLDKDTEGLLLITNDGEFEHRLMYPENHVCKTYFFWCIGSLSIENINELKNGVNIIKGKVSSKSARVDIIKSGTYEEFKDEIDSICGRNLNYNNQVVVSGYLSISEGCKHQVKRMLKVLGCYVVYLKRVSIGSVILDDTLTKGKYRELSEKEVDILMNDK